MTIPKSRAGGIIGPGGQIIKCITVESQAGIKTLIKAASEPGLAGFFTTSLMLSIKTKRFLKRHAGLTYYF